MPADLQSAPFVRSGTRPCSETVGRRSAPSPRRASGDCRGSHELGREEGSRVRVLRQINTLLDVGRDGLSLEKLGDTSANEERASHQLRPRRPWSQTRSFKSDFLVLVTEHSGSVSDRPRWWRMSKELSRREPPISGSRVRGFAPGIAPAAMPRGVRPLCAPFSRGSPLRDGGAQSMSWPTPSRSGHPELVLLCFSSKGPGHWPNLAVGLP